MLFTGWSEVASTRGGGPQDAGGEAVEGGRGRGGRGRGQGGGRFGNVGPADSYRGRGTGVAHHP